MRGGENLVREFLEIEGEGDENVPGDSHRNPDDGELVEFWELNFCAISYGAIHGGDLKGSWRWCGMRIDRTLTLQKQAKHTGR
jgi:hypothetical protein